MFKYLRHATSVVLSLVITAIQPLYADVQLFTRDLSGWTTAVSAQSNSSMQHALIDFDSLPASPAFLRIDQFSNIAGSPRISSLTNGSRLQIHQGRAEEFPFSLPNAIGPTSDFGTIVRVEFAEPVVAFAAQFLDVEPRGLKSTGFDTDGDGVPEIRFASAPGNRSKAFLGFVTDNPVNHVDIHFATTCLPAGDPTCGDGISIDDIRYQTQPNVLALHEGSTDPLTEGWVKERKFAGITTFPVDNHQNWQAWALKDRSQSDGLYSHELNTADAQRAMRDGWTLRTRVSAAEIGESVSFIPVFNTDGPRAFGVGVQRTATGTTLNLSDVASVPLGNIGDAYVMLELVYNPSTDDASVFVDGIEKYRGFKGSIPTDSHYRDRNSVWFGSGASEGRGQGNFNLVEFKVNSTAIPTFKLGENALSNAGFDMAEATTVAQLDFHDWSGDASLIATEQDSVVPIGDSMLQFTGTGSDSITSDIIQYVDVSPYREQIRSGHVRAELTAKFNRVGGKNDIDYVFNVGLAAHNGTPGSSPTHVTALKHATGILLSDEDVNTWEEASVAIKVPFNSDFLQVTLSALENVQDNPVGSEFAGHFADNATLEIYIHGDLNNDGTWNAGDIDKLSSALWTGTTTGRMDINDDGAITMDDRRYWIEVLKNTYYGDSNLDGEFNSTDLIEAMQAGEYEDSITGNSTWVEGDFSGDGEFNSTDLVLALQLGGFEQGPRIKPVPVPEPSSVTLGIVTMIGVSCLRRQSRVSH